MHNHHIVKTDFVQPNKTEAKEDPPVLQSVESKDLKTGQEPETVTDKYASTVSLDPPQTPDMKDDSDQPENSIERTLNLETVIQTTSTATDNVQASAYPTKPIVPLKKKSKTVAGLLAIFFGYFGAHWFYLGKPIRAIIYIVAYLIFPLFWLLYIVEGIYFLCTKNKSFDKYRSGSSWW